MRFFGPGWPHTWQQEQKIPVPVGKVCFYCPIRFKDNDLGVGMPFTDEDGESKEVYAHRTCLMTVLGLPDKQPGEPE